MTLSPASAAISNSACNQSSWTLPTPTVSCGDARPCNGYVYRALVNSFTAPFVHLEGFC